MFSSYRKKRRAMAALSAAAVLLTLSGCGSEKSDASSTKGVERTHLVVGTLPIPDGAPLFIAINRGFFKQEGLDVKAKIIPSGPAAIPELRADTIQFQLNNYVSAFVAESKGVLQFRYVADSYQSAPDTFDILVPAGSKLSAPKDLAGKTVAVPSLNSISTLTIAASLKPFGVEVKQLKFVEMPLPTMQAALKSGQVDAAWATEPFITAMRSGLGARKVLDTMKGPTGDFPIAGWGVTAKFAQDNPRTIAAFQRAMGKAQQLAASDRSTVTSVIPTYTKIDAKVASLISLGTYPTTLNSIRLQRVADLMWSNGMLAKKLDVKPMILARP